jgi:RNA polymerase sigma factor (sigma-70 family)
VKMTSACSRLTSSRTDSHTSALSMGDAPRFQRFDDAVPESSLVLLTRAQNGDQAALEALLARYRPRLLKWAHRRLPTWARDAGDTDDLVQNTLVNAVRNLNTFSIEANGTFQNYLRLAIRNAIRDEVRKSRRRPQNDALDPSLVSAAPSPLERAVGRQRLARYEAALEQLSPEDRDAVVARLEFGFTHSELAAVLGKRTPDAARKACQTAVARLLAIMAAADVSHR